MNLFLYQPHQLLWPVSIDYNISISTQQRLYFTEVTQCSCIFYLNQQNLSTVKSWLYAYNQYRHTYVLYEHCLEALYKTLASSKCDSFINYLCRYTDIGTHTILIAPCIITSSKSNYTKLQAVSFVHCLPMQHHDPLTSIAY